MKLPAGKSVLRSSASPLFRPLGLAEFDAIVCAALLAASLGSSASRLFAQAAVADSLEIQKLFMRASEAEKSGDLDGAAMQYQEILRLRPEMADIHNKLGFIYFLQDKYPEAIKAFQNALHLKPELFPANLGLGMSLFRYNAYEPAITPLKKALALNPTDPQAIFFLGSTYLSLQKFEDAVPLFLQFSGISPRDQDGLYALTLSAEQLYVQSFVNLAKLYPDSARTHQVEGQRLVSSKKWDEAIAEYRKAAAIAPRLEQIHLSLGDIYAQQGLAAQAATEYEDELKINPFDPLAQRGLERVSPRNPGTAKPTRPVASPDAMRKGIPATARIQYLVQSAQCSQAMDLMKSISENVSSPAVPWQWNAQCLLQLSDYRSLLRVFTQVTSSDADLLYWKGFSMQQLTSRSYEALARLEPDSARMHELAGRLAAEADNETTALEEFKLAEQRDPDMPGIHYAVGHLLMRNRQLNEAVDEFQAELKTDPYNPLVQCELGSSYLQLRAPDKAIPLLEAGLERRPDLVDARRDLGKAYGQENKWEQALAQFQTVATSTPADYSIQMLIGGAYRKLGRMPEAEAAFRRGRELQAADLSQTQVRAKSILKSDSDLSTPTPGTPADNKEVH